jgi:serine/threonine protein kinase
MSLAPGARLGAYEIVALIGAGGMGEVYRALTLDPEIATALIARAMLEIRQPVVDSGLILRLLHRAYATEPTTDACLWLAVFLCQTGRPERGLIVAEEAARFLCAQLTATMGAVDVGHPA